MEKIKKIYYAYPIDVTRSANQETEQNIKLAMSNDFVCTHLVSTETSTSWQLNLRDSTDNRQWFDAYINKLNTVGTAQLPFKLSKPKFIRRGSNVYHKIKDTSGSSNTIQLVLHGYEKIISQAYVDTDDLPVTDKRYLFSYVADISRTGSQLATDELKISNADDFIVTHIMSTQTGTFKVLIRDNGTNRQWFDGYINNANIAGTATYPFVLPKPKFIKAGSTVFFDLQDTSTSSNTIQFVLHGYRMPL